MPPDLPKNKIEQLTEFLEELEKFENISYEEFQNDRHYHIERLLELMVIYASDILLNYFSHIKEDIPTTLRTTFLRAGELQLLPEKLAKTLADAAGMRNLLVHAYTKVDLKIIYDSIKPALTSFSKFIEIMSQKNHILPPDDSEKPPKD